MQRFPVLALLILLAVSLAPGASLSADEGAGDATENAIERAETLLASGRVDDAIEALEEALAARGDADDAALRAALGRAYMTGGTPYAALQHFEKAMDLANRGEDALAYADALIAVARSHMAGGGAASVQVLPYLMDALDAATGATGEDLVALRDAVMGEARYWMGDLEDAVKLLQGADRGALEEDRARRTGELLAHALYALGRFAEAAEAFTATGNVRGAATAWSAARRGDETAAAYETLLRAGAVDATLLDEAHDAARYAGAEAKLAAVLATLEVDEAVRPAWLTTRGRLAAALGEHAAAAELLRAAAEAAPEASARPLYELGQVLLASPEGEADDRADRAAEAWVAALARSPSDERVTAALWDQAGRDYSAAWRSPRALARSLVIQRGIVKAHGDDGLAWGNLGNTLRISGQLESALEAYDRAVALEPSDPVIASDRGLVLSALGRKAEALEAFAVSTKLDPDHDAAWQNAGRLHWREGRDEDAAAALGEGLRCLRSAGRDAGRYRFLIERAWRTRHREALR